MTVCIPHLAGKADPDDLLGWLEQCRRTHGDMFQAVLDGMTVYVAASAVYAEHVLQRNWKNYRKGVAIGKSDYYLGMA